MGVAEAKILAGEPVLEILNENVAGAATTLFGLGAGPGPFTASQRGFLFVQLALMAASTVVVRRVSPGAARDFVQINGSSTVSLQTVQFKFQVVPGSVYDMLLPGASGDILAELIVTFGAQRAG